MRAFAHSLHVLISPTRSRADPDRSPSTPSRSPRGKIKERSDKLGPGRAEHAEGEASGSGSGSGSGGGTSTNDAELHVQRVDQGDREEVLTATGTGTTSTIRTILGGSEKENQTANSGAGRDVHPFAAGVQVQQRRPLKDLPLAFPLEYPAAESEVQTDRNTKTGKDKPLPPLHHQPSSTGTFLELPNAGNAADSTISSNSRSARIMDAWDPPVIVPLLEPTGSDRGFVFNETSTVVVQRGTGPEPAGGVTTTAAAAPMGRTSSRKTFRPKIKLSLNRGKSVFRPRLKERPLSRSKFDDPDGAGPSGRDTSISVGEFKKKTRGPKGLTVHTRTTTSTSSIPGSTDGRLEKVESHLPVVYPMTGPVGELSREEQPRAPGLVGTVDFINEQQGEAEGAYGGLYQEGRMRNSSTERIKADTESRPRTPVNSHLLSLTSNDESPSKAVVRSASRVEIRRVPSKRVKLQGLASPGKEGSRGRVVSSTAIYDVGDTTLTPNTPKKTTQWTDTVESSPQLLSPLKIKTSNLSPGNCPESSNAARGFHSPHMVSEIFFTPPSSTVESKPPPRISIQEEVIRSAQDEEGGVHTREERRRSMSLPSSLVRELEIQGEQIYGPGNAGFHSPAGTDDTRTPTRKVRFPTAVIDQRHAGERALLSPPPRRSSRFAASDSMTTDPRQLSFSSQPKPELKEVLPEPYDSWPVLEPVPISIAPSQEVERMSNDALQAMVAGMGALPSLILSQFGFEVLVEAAHRLKVVIDELAKKHGSEIRRRRRALLYMQQTVAKGDVRQCQRVVKVLSRMTEGVDLDQQRLFIAQDQLLQVEGLIGSHRQRVLYAALDRCTTARHKLIATIDRQKKEHVRRRSTASPVAIVPGSCVTPDNPSATASNGSKRKLCVRFQADAKGPNRSSFRRNSTRASVRSRSAVQRGSAQSGFSVDDWSVYQFPLPPSSKSLDVGSPSKVEADNLDIISAEPVGIDTDWQDRKRHSARVSSVDILFFRPGSSWGVEQHRGFPESPISDPPRSLRKSHSEETLDRYGRTTALRRRSSLRRLRPDAASRRHSSSTEPREVEPSMMALCSTRPLSTLL